jgi:hypothetical protein
MIDLTNAESRSLAPRRENLYFHLACSKLNSDFLMKD